MGDPTRRHSPTGSSLQAVASASDRARSFKQARRHTFLVRFSKLLLPIVAVVSLGAYGISVLAVQGLSTKNIETGPIKIDPKNLTMQAPKYNGFGKDGSHYVVRAREAITDLKQSGPVRLNVIDGEITQPTGVVTKLKAAWGTYDQKADILELYEKIDIDGSTGMTARLTRATVFPKESRVLSPEPIVADTDTGTIRANSMALNSKSRQATFKNSVHVTMKPAKPVLAGPVGGEKPKSAAKPSFVPGMAANTGEPIEVRSEQLDVDDTAKTALFRRDVIARQGEATLQAPELDIHYEGRAAMSDPGAAPKDGETQTKLKSIKARGGVTMVNKDDRATAQTLDYDAVGERVQLAGNVVMHSGAERQATARTADLDQKAETALLTGDVVVVQGKNTLKGQRLFVDRKAGKTRLESPAAGGAAAGRISTVLYQSNAQKPQGGKEPRSEEAANANPFGASFKSDPNQPIEIDSETLDVSDQSKQAVYKGAVVAKQGAFVIETPILTAHYTGQAGLAGDAQSPAKAKGKGEAGQSAQLTKVEAREKVRVVGKDGQRAEAENGDFDVKSNRIVLWGGRIRVEQPTAKDPLKRNVIEGPPGTRFVIDMGTGESRFEQIPGAIPAKSSGPAVSAAGPATDSASSAAAARPTEPQKPRMRAVFHPNQIGDTLKQKADDSSSGGKAGKSGSSAWESTTRSTQEKRP